jgi:hypothetical protein
MSQIEKLSCIYERAMSQGVDSLTNDDRELYLIQHFLIELEMSGLSGYFYNNIQAPGAISSTIAAMRKYELSDMAQLLSEAFELFGAWVTPENAMQWSGILRQCDPTNRIELIEDRMCSLDNYGIGSSRLQG